MNNIETLSQKIKKQEDLIEFLGRRIIDKSAKGDPCIDLIDHHSKAQRKLRMLWGEWVSHTDEVEDLIVC